MKWTDEEIKKCISLIEKLGRVRPVSEILGRTEKSIVLKMNRLGINIRNVYFPLQKKNCLNCGNELKRTHDFSTRKFCSKSCSGSYNSKDKFKTNETKEKIKAKLKGIKRSEEFKLKITGENNPKWKGGHSIASRTIKVLGKSKCGGCGTYNVQIKNKSICEDCRLNYYKFYRPSCEFNFNINSYKEEFDFKIVDKHGWYSPKNKGNNLNGVSKDHLYSVKDGFKNKVSPDLIKHPANCELLIHIDNQKKNSKSKITIDELKIRIKNFNEKYNYMNI